MGESTEQVTRATGLHKKTLALYVRLLLLVACQRVRHPGGRGGWTGSWPQGTIARCKEIQRLRDAGIGLKTIRSMLPPAASLSSAVESGATPAGVVPALRPIAATGTKIPVRIAIHRFFQVERFVAEARAGASLAGAKSASRDAFLERAIEVGLDHIARVQATSPRAKQKAKAILIRE